MDLIFALIVRPTIIVPRRKRETQNSMEKDNVMGFYVFVIIPCGLKSLVDV